MMSSPPDQRPISPYMLGPYYKFQITSFLSICSRLTGVVLAVVGAPFAILWLLALAMGPESYAGMSEFTAGWCGQVLIAVCLFSLCYHLLNSIRHLVWDTGRGFEMSQVRASGWAVVILSVVLFVVIYWLAGS